ncbi:MAG: SpoIIE family protein phosphatase [Hyphomicrobiales bacterium]
MNLAITAVLGGSPKVWPLERSKIRIGRGRDNDVHIPYQKVSREHAEILLKGDRLFLKDLHSRNGTLLNGASVRRKSELRLGDTIHVGPIALHVVQNPADLGPDLQDSGCLGTTLEIPLAEAMGHGAGDRACLGEQIQLLEKAGRLLIQRRPLRATCEELLGTVAPVLPTSRLVLLLRQGDERELRRVAVRSPSRLEREPMVLSEEALGAILDRRTAVVLSGSEGRSGPRVRRSDLAESLRPAMVVPLLYEGRPQGLFYADHDDPEFEYTRDCLAVMTLFANMTAARVANDGLLGAEKELARIEQELAMACRIQRWLLPRGDLSVEGYEIRASLESCEQVGGDFYDVHRAPNGTVWLLLGDVEGKGICGALLMSLALSSARVLYDHCGDPGELATRLNTILCDRTEPECFVTGFVGALDPESGLLRYVNAGHPYPVIVNRQRCRPLESTGTFFGVLPGFTYGAETVRLDPGDLLAIFSDAVLEAKRRGKFYGSRRFLRALRKSADRSTLEATRRDLIEDVDAFLAGLPRQDDLTLLLVRRLPAPRAASPGRTPTSPRRRTR